MLTGMLVSLAVVIAGLIFRSLVSSTKPNEDIRNWEQLMAANKLKMASLDEIEQQNMADELRSEIDRHYEHYFSDAISKGIEIQKANEVALFGAAVFAFLGGQTPSKSQEDGILSEIVPYYSLQSKEAKRAFIEYIIFKYFPEFSDNKFLLKSLFLFKDKIFEKSKTIENSDIFIFQALYIGKTDWQKLLLAQMDK
jgi:hypothetical protein